MKKFNFLSSNLKTYIAVGALFLIGTQVFGATTIQTNLSNALMVIQRVLVTADGYADWTKIMDIWNSGKILLYSQLCNGSGTSCKTFDELVWNLGNNITGFPGFKLSATGILSTGINSTVNLDERYVTTGILASLSWNIYTRDQSDSKYANVDAFTYLASNVYKKTDGIFSFDITTTGRPNHF